MNAREKRRRRRVASANDRDHSVPPRNGFRHPYTLDTRDNPEQMW